MEKALWVIIAIASVAFGQSQWTLRNPLPTNYNLSSATYGNGSYVVVGATGSILTSSDGITWASRSSGTTNNLHSATYGNKQYVAVGDSGTILTSGDGITWSIRTTGTMANLHSVVCGNNQYVIVGDFGTILTSSDCITWFSQTSGTSNNLFSVTYGGSQYVTVGGGLILTSLNGITWTSHTMPGNNQFNSVTFGNGQFAAACFQMVSMTPAAMTYTSPDGITWTGHTTGTGILTSISFGNGQYVSLSAYSGNQVLTSTDAIHWISRFIEADFKLNAISRVNNLDITVGNYGVIFTSPDAVNWSYRVGMPTTFFNSIAYGKGQYVAVGHNIVLISPDAIAWTNQPSGISDSIILTSIAYGNGIFVAVGYGNSKGAIYASPDGITWAKQSTQIDTTPQTSFYSVAFGNGQFIAAGDNGILTSSDGLVWQKSGEVLPPGYSVSYCNGHYLVGTRDVLYSSADGISWAVCPAGRVYSVAYGNGQYVAVGYAGVIFTSPDCLNWTSQTFAAGGGNLNSITFGNGQFVAVGLGGSRVFSSPDGINWTSQTSGNMGKGLNSIIFANDQFVTVGYEGTIQTSSDGGNPIKSVRNPSPLTSPLKVRMFNSLLSVSLPAAMLGKSIDIALYSASGRKMIGKKMENTLVNFCLSIPGLSKGTYILYANDSSRITTAKLAVLR